MEYFLGRCLAHPKAWLLRKIGKWPDQFPHIFVHLSGDLIIDLVLAVDLFKMKSHMEFRYRKQTDGLLMWFKGGQAPTLRTPLPKAGLSVSCGNVAECGGNLLKGLPAQLLCFRRAPRTVPRHVAFVFTVSFPSLTNTSGMITFRIFFLQLREVCRRGNAKDCYYH